MSTVSVADLVRVGCATLSFEVRICVAIECVAIVRLAPRTGKISCDAICFLHTNLLALGFGLIAMVRGFPSVEAAAAISNHDHVWCRCLGRLAVWVRARSFALIHCLPEALLMLVVCSTLQIKVFACSIKGVAIIIFATGPRHICRNAVSSVSADLLALFDFSISMIPGCPSVEAAAAQAFQVHISCRFSRSHRWCLCRGCRRCSCGSCSCGSCC